MPISQRVIKKSNAVQEQKLLQHSTGEDVLVDKTFSEMSSCLQQLSQLAVYSGEIFSGLVVLSADVKLRYDSLAARTAKLQVELPKIVVTKKPLNVAGDEYQHHRQMLQAPQPQQLVDHTTLPLAMLLRYSSSDVKPRVQFHSLDEYLQYLPLGPKAKTISQRYSNPEYFRSQWCAAQETRNKQLVHEKKQQRADKKLRKKQRATESAPEHRQPKRRSSVNWQDRYMVDGKAVNRKSVVDKNGTKGTRLSLVTAKVPIKRTESDVDAEGDEGDDEDVSAKISPIGAPLAARRNFAASLINPASMDFNGGGNSNKSSPLVRYSHIYPSKSQQQFDIETQVDDEASGVDQTGPSPGSQGTSSAPGTGPVSPAVAVAALLPPRKPAPPAPPGGGGPAPAAYGKPEENPSYSKAEGNGAYSKASATAPVPPPPTPPAPPAVYKPQSDGLSLAANKPAPSSSSVVPPPPPPPPGSKTASPPPPPVNSDDRNVNKMIATGLIPPPPTAQQLQESAVVAAGTADSDSDAEEGEEEEEENGGSAREESPAVPVPMQVAASSKGNYLDDMLSRSGSLKLTGSFFGGGGSAGQSAPPPPPPPPLPARVRTASTDANAVAGPGVASPVRILLKPRPTSSNTDASVSVTPRAARLSTSARTASTDSVSSQLSGYPFLAAGAGVAGVSAMLSGLTVAADEHEAEIDHFAAVNSAESSFNKNVSELMASTAGKVSLMDAIKQGTGLRKVSTESTTATFGGGVGGGRDSKSGGRVSLLDAIKQGSGTLRKVLQHEQAAAQEEKKRSGSSLGGFGSSSVTAILERRKFLMAEESSDSESDDGEWS